MKIDSTLKSKYSSRDYQAHGSKLQNQSIESDDSGRSIQFESNVKLKEADFEIADETLRFEPKKEKKR